MIAATMDRQEIMEERLIKEGWIKRCSAIEPRLSELVTLYTELGFEVRCESVDLAQLPSEGCRECFLVQYERYKTIYTRPIGRNPRLPPEAGKGILGVTQPK